jgi:hypothetical protein
MFDDPTTAAQNDATVKLTYRIRYWLLLKKQLVSLMMKTEMETRKQFLLTAKKPTECYDYRNRSQIPTTVSVTDNIGF